MESRAGKAGELFMEGCNCAQAVFVTYADLYGFDRATAMAAVRFPVCFW